MKRKITFCLLLASLIVVTSLAGCGSKESAASSENESEESYIEYDPANNASVSSSDENTVGADITENPYYNVEGGVDASWFDDAVFIGDSITLKLSYYQDATAAFGNASFLCSGSIGWTNAQWDLDDPSAVHPYYNGEYVLLEDAAVLTGANKAFICLGMNDIGLYGVDRTIESARSFLEKFKVKSPEVQIYIQSVTPMIEEKQTDSFNNDLIREFDAALEQLAAEEGCTYLNTIEAFEDSEGNLPMEYCGDPEALGVHFTHEACQIWENYLKTHVS